MTNADLIMRLEQLYNDAVKLLATLVARSTHTELGSDEEQRLRRLVNKASKRASRWGHASMKEWRKSERL